MTYNVFDRKLVICRGKIPDVIVRGDVEFTHHDQTGKTVVDVDQSGKDASQWSGVCLTLEGGKLSNV